MTGTPFARRNQPVCLACGFSRSPWPPAAEAAGKRILGQPYLAASFLSARLTTALSRSTVTTGCHITKEDGARRIRNASPLLVDTRAKTEAETLGLLGTTRNSRNHQTGLLTLYATCGVMERNARIEPRTYICMNFYRKVRTRQRASTPIVLLVKDC